MNRRIILFSLLMLLLLVFSLLFDRTEGDVGARFQSEWSEAKKDELEYYTHSQRHLYAPFYMIHNCTHIRCVLKSNRKSSNAGHNLCEKIIETCLLPIFDVFILASKKLEFFFAFSTHPNSQLRQMRQICILKHLHKNK